MQYTQFETISSNNKQAICFPPTLDRTLQNLMRGKTSKHSELSILKKERQAQRHTVLGKKVINNLEITVPKSF